MYDLMQVQKSHLHSLKLQQGDVTAEVGKRLEAMVEACAASALRVVFFLVVLVALLVASTWWLSLTSDKEVKDYSAAAGYQNHHPLTSRSESPFPKT